MKIARILVALSSSALALVLTGCATASKPSAMVATLSTSPTKHPESVNVAVSGGSETSSMGASKISNSDFAQAIETSILQSGLFAKINATNLADYNLSVQIVRLDQPFFGTSFTVNLETTWRLTQRSTQQVVWEKAVVSSFTATMGDAFSGVTRLRLANEGAARANIEDALTQLGSRKLP